MKIQIITIGVLLAATRGVIIPPDSERYPSAAVGPISFPSSDPKPEEPFSSPTYTYGYDVHYPITGDSKVQQETREKDVVRDSYSFIETDGNQRIVNYAVNLINNPNGIIVSKKPAFTRPGIVAPVAEATPAAVSKAIALAQIGIAKPTFAVSSAAGVPVAVAVRPIGRPFAPVRFLLGRYGYTYSHTPFGFSYSY